MGEETTTKVVKKSDDSFQKEEGEFDDDDKNNAAVIEINSLFKHLPSFFEDDELNVPKKRQINENLKMNQIVPRLFLSDDVIARNKTVLDKHNITHILNLTTNIPNKFEPDITYLKLIIFDFETQNISQYFSESFEFIENALKEERNCVLVHCNAGISRSSSFVIAYLLQKRIFKKYKDAYNHVKKARPVIEPNRGFEKQLINLEKRIRKTKQCSIM